MQDCTAEVLSAVLSILSYIELFNGAELFMFTCCLGRDITRFPVTITDAKRNQIT